MKLIIYGAGDYGKRLYHFLEMLSVRVECFCQSEVLEESYLLDKKIIPIDMLLEIEEDIVVLIAIADGGVSHSIKLQLINCLSNGSRIYECGGFIETNLSSDDMNGGKMCILCKNRIGDFYPIGVSDSVFDKYHIIGGGYRENGLCPRCRSIDRERWVFYVLKTYTGIFKEQCDVLHFAPEQSISEQICANPRCNYYSGDIMRGRAQHVVDALDLQFRDGTFDYIIMNHVLEHIEDESKAVSEVKRVLKKDGKLILSFPICTDQKTYEDSEIKTEEERLKEYGQKDHVRLYGKDYKQRIEQYGLHMKVYTPRELCSKEEIDYYGFIEDDVLMICSIR